MFLREGGWGRKKEQMPSNQGPKLIKTVSFVSAAPALVDRINLLLKRRLRQRLVALVISLGLCLLACSLEVAHQRSCASGEQPEYVLWVHTGLVGVPGKQNPFTNATSSATRPCILYLVLRAFRRMPT
jgi:hypothetical protein